MAEQMKQTMLSIHRENGQIVETTVLGMNEPWNNAARVVTSEGEILLVTHAILRHDTEVLLDEWREKSFAPGDHVLHVGDIPPRRYRVLQVFPELDFGQCLVAEFGKTLEFLLPFIRLRKIPAPGQSESEKKDVTL